MTTAIIINNFDNSTDLCENWGWYVDLDPPNHPSSYNKYKVKKIKPIYILEINEQETNKNLDEYEYYMNQSKKYKIKNTLEPIFEDKEEEEEIKDCYNRKKTFGCHVLRITSVTIITGLLTYIILFTI